MFENDYAAVKEDQPDLPLTQVNDEELGRGGMASSTRREVDF